MADGIHHGITTLYRALWIVYKQGNGFHFFWYFIPKYVPENAPSNDAINIQLFSMKLIAATAPQNVTTVAQKLAIIGLLFATDFK